MTNPAANTAEGTPIYGMPVLDVAAAKHIVICNYDLKPGYAGVDNPLYSREEGVSLILGNAAETLQEMGIKVLLVNPEDQQQLTGMIDLIAAATGTSAQAQQLKDFAAAQEAALAETLADAEKPTVYLAGNSSMLSTAGDAMYQSDMIRIAGGVNVAGEITDAYWVEISYEQLLAWDPAYILLASDATYTVEDVLTDVNLSGLKAVANGQVYQLPSKAEAWDSPVPSGILGALWLANVLHGDVLTDADCADRIDEYYETFYDFTYSEN